MEKRIIGVFIHRAKDIDISLALENLPMPFWVGI